MSTDGLRLKACRYVMVAMALVPASVACAQDALDQQADHLIRTEMAAQKIPGVSVAVIRDGQVVLVKGYGLANVEHAVAVKPGTVFQSGSVGKQFTAMAVMLLVDEGKIDLDERIGTYLGDVPGSWKDMTVRQLLTHTSGMADYTSDFNLWQDYSEDELLDKAKKVPTAFAPGEKWQYSNLGYLTLGAIVRRVSGKFYGDFLQERVFDPLGMTTARVISEADIIPDRAMGYRLENGELKHQHWVAPQFNTTADGALYLTALDMIKWEQALSGGKLLAEESYAQMWSPVRLNSGKTHPYGFGWMLGEVNAHREIEHGGAWQGFKAQIVRYPEDRLAVVVFANLAQADPAGIARGVAAIYEPGLVPRPIEDAEPGFTALVREQMLKIADGNPDLDLFAPELQKLISGPGDRFGAFLESMGGIRNVELFSRSGIPEGVAYRYRFAFAQEAAYLDVVRLKDGKIGALGFKPAD